MTDYDALASACLLLHGNPPKQLVLRQNLFSCRNPAAWEYRRNVERFVFEHHPVIERVATQRKVVIERNKVLRCMYAQLKRTR